MTPPGPGDKRDQLVKKHPPQRQSSTMAVQSSVVPAMEASDADTDVGGDYDSRIEKRVTSTDRSTRAAFALIRELKEDFKELKDDFKAHAIVDKEALDEIRADNKAQSDTLTLVRLSQAETVVELRAVTSALKADADLGKLRAAAAVEVAKQQATDQVETKKFQREHMSRKTIQLLAIVGAAIVATLTALLTAYFKK